MKKLQYIATYFLLFIDSQVTYQYFSYMCCAGSKDGEVILNVQKMKNFTDETMPVSGY
jgi:hypothetical protein